EREPRALVPAVRRRQPRLDVGGVDDEVEEEVQRAEEEPVLPPTHARAAAPAAGRLDRRVDVGELQRVGLHGGDGAADRRLALDLQPEAAEEAGLAEEVAGNA